MHNITVSNGTITLSYNDSKNTPVKLSAELNKYSKLFDLARDMHDSKRIVNKGAFDRDDMRIYRACGENLYEALGDYFFGMVRAESPSQEPLRKALQDYLDLWGKGWVADNRFIMMMLPFVGDYRTEKNTLVNDEGEWVEEVRKVFKQSATSNTFTTKVERMLFDSVENKTMRTFAELKAARKAKEEAKKAAKKAEKEAQAAKNVQA